MLAHVITVSDRSAAGVRDDLSGPLACERLREAGFEVSSAVVSDGVPSVTDALRAALAVGARVVVTSGGTGLGPRDLTPEATRSVIEREVPGLAELLRLRGLEKSPHAMLSRGIAGIVGDTIIVNLPGSPKAVGEGLDVLLPLLPHMLDQLSGGDH